MFQTAHQQELRRGHYNEARVVHSSVNHRRVSRTLCARQWPVDAFPIGSKVSSIPAIISNFGLILERRDAALLERLIAEALVEIEKGQLTPEAISRSIFDRYSIEARTGKLVKAIHQLAKQTEHS